MTRSTLAAQLDRLADYLDGTTQTTPRLTAEQIGNLVASTLRGHANALRRRRLSRAELRRKFETKPGV